MSYVTNDIRGVMIPVSGGRALLPNATVAEVITFSNPEPIADAPAWLLGRLPWRGWRLPLFSFAMLAGTAHSETSSNAKVTVLKALGGHPRMPFMAMLAQGFPRLTTLNDEVIVPLHDAGDEMAVGVLGRVMVRDDEAMIPDLDRIEAMIAAALGLPDPHAAA